MNCQLSLINFGETPNEALFLTYLVAGKVETANISLLKSPVATRLLPTESWLWASAEEPSDPRVGDEFSVWAPEFLSRCPPVCLECMEVASPFCVSLCCWVNSLESVDLSPLLGRCWLIDSKVFYKVLLCPVGRERGERCRNECLSSVQCFKSGVVRNSVYTTSPDLKQSWDVPVVFFIQKCEKWVSGRWWDLLRVREQSQDQKPALLFHTPGLLAWLLELFLNDQ